jgi:hypothetical protein
MRVYVASATQHALQTRKWGQLTPILIPGRRARLIVAWTRPVSKCRSHIHILRRVLTPAFLAFATAHWTTSRNNVAASMALSDEPPQLPQTNDLLVEDGAAESPFGLSYGLTMLLRSNPDIA